MKRRAIFLIIVGTLVLGMALWLQNSRDGKVFVSFMNVGQGDAILMRQGNFDVLVDGGPDLTVLQRLGENRPAWDRKIDVVVLTHPDQDHLGGLLYVVKKYEVGTVVLPKIIENKKNYRIFLQSVMDKKIPIVFAEAGQTIIYNDIKLDILSPDEKLLTWSKTNINNASVVARLIVPGVSLLLTGDIEAPTENYLAKKYGSVLTADILKVGHHGSKTSSSTTFLDFVKPKMAIISVGVKNMYGHPNPLTLKRLGGVKVERTDRMGTITLESNVGSGSVKLRCEKECEL
ncbi:MAG: ComEC/Rec2 family competence protein [bacterium]|nr:ComEC/Rec2 family competence protein [bacterium]